MVGLALFWFHTPALNSVPPEAVAVTSNIVTVGPPQPYTMASKNRHIPSLYAGFSPPTTRNDMLPETSLAEYLLTGYRGFESLLLRSPTQRQPKTRKEKEGREKSRPSLLAYAKGDGQPAGSPVETRDAFTVHPPS
jgi:hypothetical protein